LLEDDVKAQVTKDLVKDWASIAITAQGRKPKRPAKPVPELDLKRPLTIVARGPRKRANSFRGEGILQTKSETLVSFFLDLEIACLVQEAHPQGLV